MAGQPKTRAKREAEARAAAELAASEALGFDPGTIPEAVTVHPVDGTVPGSAYTRARARPFQPTGKGSITAGPATRSAVDTAVGQEMSRLAQALRPGVVARLTRTRPTYAAGWVEDYPLDSDRVGELLEYLANEHGGQSYKVTVINPSGHPYFESNIQIAGPPKRRGKLVSRDSWDGPEAEIVAQPAKQDQSVELLLKFMALQVENERHSADRLLKSISDIVASSKESNAQLMREIVSQRRAEAEATNINTQIENLGRAVGALRRVASSVEPPKAEPIAEKTTEPEDDLNGVMKDALRGFVGDVLKSQVKFPSPKNNHSSPSNGFCEIPEAKLEKC